MDVNLIPRPLLFLVLALLLFNACKPAAEDAATTHTPRPAVVTVETVVPQVLQDTISTHGTIEAQENVTLSVDFTAVVRAVNFRENQKVSAGQVLIEFRSEERELAVKEAEARVSEALARMNQTRELFDNRGALYARNAASLEEFRAAQTDFQSARAGYEQALVARSLARHQLTKTELVCPVDAAVTSKNVRVGQTALPGVPLVRLQYRKGKRVLCYVTEKDINALRVGGEASVTTPAVRGKTYSARVTSLGTEADPQTGNFQVELSITDADNLLRSGMTAGVLLEGLTYPRALVVPESALVDRNRKRLLFKVVDNKAVAVEPVPAATFSDTVPILEGIQAGDVVIVGGADQVRDGSPVIIAEPTE